MPKPSKQDLSRTWEVITQVLPLTQRALLWGPPGTGKTVAAVTLGVRPDQKVFMTTLTDETPSAELRGHFVPRGRRFIWHDGPAVAAWRAGARLVLNEIDRASSDTLTFLLALLDDPDVAMLSLPSGEMVRPHQRFTVVATMNTSPTANLPSPLRDRFPVTLPVDAVNPAALARLPEDLRAAAIGTTFADDPERRLSIRVWLEFGRLRQALDPETATLAVFGPRAAEVLTALRVAKGTVSWFSVKMTAVGVTQRRTWAAPIATVMVAEGAGRVKAAYRAV